jgi:OOP family OmpA-OmpF porin
MTSTHPLRVLSLALLAAFGVESARAQDSGYPYLGLSVGQSRAKIDQERITAGLLGAGLATSSMSKDESDKSYKLFGGYQFTPNFALEAGYFKLGQFGFVSTTVPPGSLSGQIKLHGVNLDLVGSFPLTDRLSAIGRLGAQRAKATDRFIGTGAVGVLNPNPTKTETNGKLGLGLQYAITPSFLMRAEVEHYRVNDAVGNRGGVNVVSVSLVIPFGRAPAAAPRVAYSPPVAAPAPMPAPAPAPAPPPVVAYTAPAPVAPPAPVPPPPERRRVSFSTDSLFAFDRSEVRPEGLAALDKFANELRGTEFVNVSVRGHTDRLGATDYNQRLSVRRAEAVKSHLLRAAGIDPNKLSVNGLGESEPTGRTGDCKGSRPTPALIACLQPDRRVEVEVTGTR